MGRWIKIILLAVVVLFVAGLLILRADSKPVAPDQPIAYNHWQHITSKQGPELSCDYGHEYADKSAHATIPNVTTCMGCHAAVKTESPEIQKLAEIAKRKEEPKWVRIYYYEPEADVFFSHNPHMKAN